MQQSKQVWCDLHVQVCTVPNFLALKGYVCCKSSALRWCWVKAQLHTAVWGLNPPHLHLPLFQTTTNITWWQLQESCNPMHQFWRLDDTKNKDYSEYQWQGIFHKIQTQFCTVTWHHRWWHLCLQHLQVLDSIVIIYLELSTTFCKACSHAPGQAGGWLCKSNIHSITHCFCKPST